MYEALLTTSESKMGVVDEDEDTDQHAVADQGTRDENHGHCQPQPLNLCRDPECWEFRKSISGYDVLVTMRWSASRRPRQPRQHPE